MNVRSVPLSQGHPGDRHLVGLFALPDAFVVWAGPFSYAVGFGQGLFLTVLGLKTVSEFDTAACRINVALLHQAKELIRFAGTA